MTADVDAAKKAATMAESYATHPALPDESGYYKVWNAETKEYDITKIPVAPGPTGLMALFVPIQKLDSQPIVGQLYNVTNANFNREPLEGEESVTADGPYKSFECRATKSGESWGVGIGTLIASFSQTPANTSRSFDIYDDYLVRDDGEYRISLFAQDMNGSWYILTPLFEFQFSNESLNENLIEFGDLSY